MITFTSLPELFKFAAQYTKNQNFLSTLEEAIGSRVPEPDAEPIMDAIITGIESLYTLTRLRSDDETKQAQALNGLLNAMSVTAFNRKYGDELQKRIDTMQRHIQGQCRARTFAQRAKKDPLGKQLARYAIAGRYYANEKPEAIASAMHERGVLSKLTHPDGKVTIFIDALHCKVGDNVFSFDSKGRERRNYLTVVYPQLFPLPAKYANLLSHLQVDDMNELDSLDGYSITHFGDGKGLARRFPVKWNAMHETLRSIDGLR